MLNCSEASAVKFSSLDGLLRIFIYVWFHWVFVAALALFPFAASGGYSLVAVCRCLMVVASLVENRF